MYLPMHPAGVRSALSASPLSKYTFLVVESGRWLQLTCRSRNGVGSTLLPAPLPPGLDAFSRGGYCPVHFRISWVSQRRLPWRHHHPLPGARPVGPLLPPGATCTDSCLGGSGSALRHCPLALRGCTVWGRCGAWESLGSLLLPPGRPLSGALWAGESIGSPAPPSGRSPCVSQAAGEVPPGGFGAFSRLCKRFRG